MMTEAATETFCGMQRTMNCISQHYRHDLMLPLKYFGYDMTLTKLYSNNKCRLDDIQ